LDGFSITINVHYYSFLHNYEWVLMCITEVFYTTSGILSIGVMHNIASYSYRLEVSPKLCKAGPIAPLAGRVDIAPFGRIL